MTSFPMLHVLNVPGLSLLRDENVAALAAETPICLHTDPERHGVLWNWKGALRCARDATDEPWVVVVQDDAITLPNWKVNLLQALTFAPEPVCGLLHFGAHGKKLAARGYPYGVAVNAVWGGAIAYRRSILDGLIELSDFAFAAGWNSQQKAHGTDDGLITAFNLLRGGQSCFTSRSVFDHRAEWKSTIGNGGPLRYPKLTIAQPGPWWGATPRAGRLSASVPDDARELVALWRGRESA
jgi:hypothetical protein